MSNHLKLVTLIATPLLVLSMLFAVPVYADQTFHTVNLSLVLTSAGKEAGNPVLRAGHVIDIHANGPNIYSLERYMLNGAMPNTKYQVVLMASLTGCGHPQNVPVPTALLTTNAQGNAHGEHTFTPKDVAAFGLHPGMTLGITWTFQSGETVAYQTPSCTNVALD